MAKKKRGSTPDEKRQPEAISPKASEGSASSAKKTTRKKAADVKGEAQDPELEATPKAGKLPEQRSKREQGEPDAERKSEPEPKKKPSGRLRGAQVFMAVGVLAATLIAVSLNVLVTRFYKRWDWTSDGLYTLNQATLDTLQGLDEPVDVVVFLSRSDNMRVSVEHMLGAYGAETRQLRVRYVDPDQNPAEFMTLQKQYDINQLATDDGRLVSETAIVLARGKKHWYVTADDIMSVDETGAVKPKLEQALTVGLRNILGSDVTRVCFTAGHQEASIESGAGDGMAELKFRIKHDNYEPVLLDMTEADWPKQLVQCQVVVSAPEVPIAAKDVETLTGWFTAGGNMLLLLNPVLADDEPEILPCGLEPLAKRAGITLGADLIIEDSPKLKLTSTGEIFLAAAGRHEITRGLFSTRDDTTTPLIFKVAQSLGRTPESNAQVLANTSDTAYTLKDVGAFLKAGEPPRRAESSLVGPLPVAMAAELPMPEGAKADHGPRIVVIGSASVALNDNWRAPALAPNAALVTSALSWLAAKPPLVDVPEKQTHDVGLNLTEESQSDVAYYVLLYMPLSALLIGGFVLYRRRSTERRSRRREDDDS